MAACVYSVERRPRIFMAERKLPTRAAILAAGCIMFLFTGTIYAWSILSSPFPVEFGWISAQLGLNFTIVMSCFCIGGLAGSFVTRRLSARVTVLIGAVMCFLGYFLCSRITAQSLWLLYISYGGLIGLGVGFSYNAVLGTVVGWFPDKKGFASGVLLMGFGCSTLIMGNLADRLFNSAMGWRTAYLLLFGELPTREELAFFQRTLADSRTLPTNFVRDVIMKAPSRDMMNSLSRSVLTLASYDDNVSDVSLANVLRQCLMLIAVFPLLAVYGYHSYNHYERDESLYIHRPDDSLSAAENLLRMLRPDKSYTDLEARVLDLALILHMEHLSLIHI